MRKREGDSMRKKLKILFGVILVLVLVVGGFALGVYLRLFDTQALNEELGLHELPVIGEYFVPPAGQGEKDVQSGTLAAATEPSAHTAVSPQRKQAANVRITKEEVAKQQAERETAEKKRVTKIARLYNEMKAKDAAKVMESLDIDLCIAILQRMDEGSAAKILAAFEPERAAQITQIIYQGAPRRTPQGRGGIAVPGEPPAAVPGMSAESVQQ